VALTEPPLSLYVHFPWCVRKCPYCDFNSYTLHGELQESRYLQALISDLEAQSGQVRGRTLVSIFFGGGTPSLFSPEAMGRVLEATHRLFAVEPGCEVTLEANPGTIERGQFADYRAAGVNRVSLGAQSFDAARLQQLGRIHSPDETRRAAEELHAAGLDNFNLDLMYALPGQDLQGAVADVREALRLHPAHLSHYQLTIEPGTVFAGAPPELPSDDIAAAMLEACAEELSREGFAQYEVSAYARPGRRCVHNLNYWLFGDYIGAGAGAHGKLTASASGTITRTVQQRDPRRYIAASPEAISRHSVPAEERPFEFMLNALRLVEGFPIALFEERTGLPWSAVESQVDSLQTRGLLSVSDGVCRTSPRGAAFLNEILLGFLSQRAENSGPRELSTGSSGPPSEGFMHRAGGAVGK
jgi:putative oxygen-independent coproporphyrinogen III oxidase